MDDETMVYFGGAVKALGDGRVGGYLVTYGSPTKTDITGEFFAADTDFDKTDGERVSVYYHHGLDKTLGNRKLGNGALKMDDTGIWVEAQLALRDDYEKKIYSLVEQGKLGWSSGSAAHLVAYERAGNARKIASWPLVDASLTPTPAEPNCVAVPLKSLLPEAEEGEKLTLAERFERLAVYAREVIDDMQEIHAMRVKAGRVLSQPNRERLTNHLTTLKGVCDDMGAMLEETAPEPVKDAADATDFLASLTQERLRTERILAGMHGVPA